MSDNKKFLFDLNNFDVDYEEEKNKKPKEPTFNLQDMEDARKAAFEQGKAEGLQTAKDGIEQRTEILVQSLAKSITSLETHEKERQEQFTQDALVIAYKTLAQIVPQILETTRSDNIKQFLSEFFLQTASKRNFCLFVHPEMIESVEPHAQHISSNLEIQGDSTLSPTQARIEWTHGTATFSPESIADKILLLIKENISDPTALEAELLDESEKNPHNEEDNTDKGD